MRPGDPLVADRGERGLVSEAMSLDELPVVAHVPGPIHARVRLLGERRVSWLEFEAVELINS